MSSMTLFQLTTTLNYKQGITINRDSKAGTYSLYCGPAGELNFETIDKNALVSKIRITRTRWLVVTII